MKNRDDIKGILDYFQKAEDRPFEFDEEGIINDFRKYDDNHSLPIKILSVFGGILASLAFLGFLFIAGLYNSDLALLIIGGIFIAGSIWINKVYHKIIFDTVSVSAFMIGFMLLGLGCGQLKVNENIVCIIFITIALGSLIIAQNFILSFISILIINGSILALLLLNNSYELIHVYVSALAVTITYFFLKEARIILTSEVFSKLYDPVKTGLLFSFLSGLVFIGKRGILPLSPGYIWLSSVVIISVIVYLVSVLLDVFNIISTRHKGAIYVFSILGLLPIALSPAISGAILIMMLSFFVNYKTGLVLGIVSFIYFVSQYYYDLNFTLLTKSILLFSTGVLSIAIYLLASKKLTANEKV